MLLLLIPVSRPSLKEHDPACPLLATRKSTSANKSVQDNSAGVFGFGVAFWFFIVFLLLIALGFTRRVPDFIVRAPGGALGFAFGFCP